MLKQKEYKLEDSNVAGLGGDADRALRASAAKKEPAWKKWAEYLDGSILNSKEAVQYKGKPHYVDIWRIEKFKVKAWPRPSYGKFHTGDSYIILHIWKEDGEDGTKDKVLYDIHFWLGEETSQDEMGTAAYKTVELDTLLDDRPVQRRETQANESAQFYELFTKILSGGVRYEPGGIDSGFNHVKPEEYKPRLLHLKGRKKVRVNAVEMSMKSLNSGDVFILDMGATLYTFQGKSCGQSERRQAAETTNAIKTDRKGKVNCIFVTEGQNDSDLIEFYKLLGGTVDDPIASAESAGGDDEVEKKTQKILYRLSDSSGSLKFTKEAEGDAVNTSKFDESDVFVVDCGYVIYVWVGKNTSESEKAKCMEFADKYLKDNNRPSSVQVQRVLSGSDRAAQAYKEINN